MQIENAPVAFKQKESPIGDYRYSNNRTEKRPVKISVKQAGSVYLQQARSEDGRGEQSRKVRNETNAEFTKIAGENGKWEGLPSNRTQKVLQALRDAGFFRFERYHPDDFPCFLIFLFIFIL